MTAKEMPPWTALVTSPKMAHKNHDCCDLFTDAQLNCRQPAIVTRGADFIASLHSMVIGRHGERP